MTARFLFAAAMLAAGPSAADVLERMAQTGVLRVGVRADAPPLSYFDAETGAPAGYAVTVCRRVAERLGMHLGLDALTLEAEAVGQARGLDAVAQGEVDILCGAEPVTLTARAIVDFSIPIFIETVGVVTRSADAEGFAGLAGGSIGVLASARIEALLNEWLDQLGIVADVVAVRDHGEGLARLLAQDVDAVFGDQTLLAQQIANAPDPDALRLTADALRVDPRALALPLGDWRLRLQVDRALSDLWRSGEIARIFDATFAPKPMGGGMRMLSLTAPLAD